jgi:hypothetical protein
MPTKAGEISALNWETNRVHSPISPKRRRINPNYGAAYVNRGVAYYDLGDY